MKLSLNIQILIGALVGVISGIIFNQLGPTYSLYPSFIYGSELVGRVFVDLLKMILVPLIFTSIAVGIANLKAHHQMDKVWKITLIYFLATPIIAAILGL